VTDQYLEYLAALEELRVDDLADFVVVAARLLLIKSQVLLPRPRIPGQPPGEDAGEQLLRQLRLYKQFKEAAKNLDERQRGGHRSYVRISAQPRIESAIEHLEAVPLQALLAAARHVLTMRSTTPPVEDNLNPFPVTMEDQMNLIAEAVQKNTEISFTDLLTAAYTRQEIAVTFMACLELIKQKLIYARQERLFGEIMIQAIS
jgi:segregation and condensation protein A